MAISRIKCYVLHYLAYRYIYKKNIPYSVKFKILHTSPIFSKKCENKK